MNELGPRGPRDFLLTPGTTPQASALSAASEEPEDTASTEHRGPRGEAGGGAAVQSHGTACAVAAEHDLDAAV